MDRRGLERLLEFDKRVLELVAVVLREGELPGRVRAGEGDRVRLQGRREVNERLLNREELQEDVVRNRLVEFLFERVRPQMDVVDVAEEQDARVPQEAERETVLVRRRTNPADLVEERRRHGRRDAADGDDRLSEKNDAQRDRAVGDDGIVRDGTRHMDEEQGGVVVVVIETRTFIRIERVGQKVAPDVRIGKNPLQFRRRRFDEIDPARIAEIGRLLESAVHPLVNRQHGVPPSPSLPGQAS